MSPQLRRKASVQLRTPAEWKDFIMPEMFDWIFFAIVGIPLVVVTWDWLRNR